MRANEELMFPSVVSKRNVFDWLDEVRKRPRMLTPDNSLRELETLVWGYEIGLGFHGIVETCPEMGLHFLHWLQRRTGWSTCSGFAGAIETRYTDPDEALAVFFSFVDEYRKLRPTLLCTVRLGKQHNPTGKRVRDGLDRTMDKPERVDIMRYRPEPLHFIRFHYPERIENRSLFMTGRGEYATTLRFAKEWVRDELQVDFEEWEAPPKSGRGERSQVKRK